MPLDLTTITGTAYDPIGGLAVGVTIYVKEARKAGSLIEVENKRGVTNASGLIKAEDGTSDFKLPRNAQVKLSAPIVGLNAHNGVWVTTPDSAGPIDLATLIAVASVPSVGITVKDEGVALASLIGTFNFTGSGVVVTQTAPGVAQLDFSAGSGGSPHDLLSVTHPDTTAAAVARGDLIIGQGATPKWARKAIGASGQYLRSDGTDLLYSAIQVADIPSLDAAKITSGQFADARIASAATWNAKQDALGFTPENSANKNQANGYAGLDGSSKLNPAHLPAIAISNYLGSVASQAAMLALTGERGDWAIRSDENKTYIIIGDDPTQLSSWQAMATPTDLVSSVFGRTGTVTAQANDYTWAQIDKTTSSLADIATRSASDLSSGTLPDARFPVTLPALSGVNLTALNASNLGSGTVPDARFPATLPALSGANLTALNATNIASGSLADARLSSNVPLKNAQNEWTAKQTIDLGTLGSSYSIGLLIRNDTLATVGVPIQDAPLIIFEAHGWYEDETRDTKWEMNERFEIDPGNTRKARFAWEWRQDGGSWALQQYLTDSGDLGVTGYLHANLGVFTGPTFASGTNLNPNGLTISATSGIIENNIATNPLRFQSTNTTATAFRFTAASTLTSGNLFEGVVPDSGFTGSLLKLGRSSNGLTITTTLLDITATGAAHLIEQTTPATPPTGYVAFYAKSDGKLYRKDDAGTEAELGGGGGGGATTALDNLASVAINTSLISDTDNTDDLGSSAKTWRIGYFGTHVKIGGIYVQPSAINGSTMAIIAGDFNTYRSIISARFMLGADDSTGWDVGIGRAEVAVASFETANAGGSGSGTWRAIAKTATQVTSDQNNYNPGGKSYFQRWSTDASRNITGLTFTAAQVDGQVHVIINIGSTDIVLKNESASSTAANRFKNSTGADITLTANQSADLIYDGTASRWLVFKRN